MARNIKLAYLICFFRYTWFWLGLWVFYYLRFTNYGGIGLIETSLIIAMTVSEIPTGAIADLIGKRNCLVLSFFLQAFGIFILAFYPTLLTSIIGVFIAGIGASFFSGTFEALVYDSLKEQKKETEYDKVIAKTGTISLVTPSLCGIAGGFMYIFSPNLPYIAAGFGYISAMITSYFLIEPQIDSEKFNVKNFLLQMKHGLKILFRTTKIAEQTLLLLSIGVVIVISDEMINSFLGVEFGYPPNEIGIFWAVIFLISSVSSQLTPQIRRKFHLRKAMILVGILTTLTFIISPFAGKIVGGISLLLRVSLMIIFLNLTSIAINDSTDSKYRATTLSTFNMMKNIPYVLLAFFIGSLSDLYSAKIIAFWLGITLLILITIQLVISSMHNRTKERLIV